MEKICAAPFRELETNSDGNAAFCCSAHINQLFIGNMYQEGFSEFWNSPLAVEIREKILKGDYSMCDKNICYALNNPDFVFVEKTPDMKPVMEKGPETVKLMHDSECNARCIICRDIIYRRTPEELENLNSKIPTIFMPMLKDAKLVILNAAGDPFASRHNIELIKEINKNYPQVKYEFHTNGILASENMINRLGIIDKIHKVIISIHATTKETYEKIVVDGNFDKLMTNLSFLADLHRKGKIDDLDLCFVVTAYNYQEMPAFLAQTKKLGAKAYFWEFRTQGHAKKIPYEVLAVHEPTHEEHSKLLEVLKDDIFDSVDYGPLHPVLRKLRQEALK